MTVTSTPAQDPFWKHFDRYDFRTRVRPGLLAVCAVAVCAGPLAASVGGWGWGAGAAIAFGVAILAAIAYAARAAGKRLEERLLKEWGGYPTTRWLRRSDLTLAKQEKTKLYAAIKVKTGYKLGDALKDASAAEEDRTIEAAVKVFRRQLCEGPAGRLLIIHNEEYGYARNMAGLRWWLLGITAACLAASGVGAWSGLTTTVPLFLESAWAVLILFFAFTFTPRYVCQCAERYAETLFSTAQQAQLQDVGRKEKNTDDHGPTRTIAST